MNCSGKIEYATERQALDDLRLVRRMHRGHGRKYLNVYGCSECGCFHIGRSFRSYREKTARRETKAEPPRRKELTSGELRRKAIREIKEAKRHLVRAAVYYDAIGNNDPRDWADSWAWAMREANIELGIK